MDGEVIVAFDGRSILVSCDSAIPAAVVVLVAGQPVEGALDGQLAGALAPMRCGAGRAVRIEPGLIKLGNVCECAAARPIAQCRQSRASSRRQTGFRCGSGRRYRPAKPTGTVEREW